MDRAEDLAREQVAVPVEALGEIPDAEALKAIDQATRRADRRVAKAERRLRAVEKAGSKREINAARNALTQATSTRHQARLALERARAGYVGSPREVVAQAKRVQKAERKLTKVERERGAIILANERQAAREGRDVTPEEFAALRAEWQEIGQATKYHDGTLLPPEVAASLDQVHRLITPTMRDEDSVLAVSRFMRNLTGRWKALALLSPGYFARNVLDDGLRAYWAGARNPASFVQATRALRGGKGTVRLEGRDYTLADLVNLAESNGVIRTGYVRTEVTSSADEAVLRGRFAGPGRGPLARFSGDANELREDATRLGTFIDLMKRGDDPDTAARQVRTYLFDYSEVGAFVESARRFWLPFITFTSKAIPLTAREFVRRPGRAANISKVMAASEQAAGNPDMSYLPRGRSRHSRSPRAPPSAASSAPPPTSR